MNDLNRRRFPLGPARSDEQREKDARLRDLLESADWEDVTARLTASAHRLMRKKRPLADAEDVAQKAICQLLDPDYKAWNPDEKTLLEHLESVAVGIIHNRYVNVGDRMTDAVADVDTKPVARDVRLLEDDVSWRELHDLVFAALRRHFAGKTLELALVQLFAEGADLPRDQVAALGLPYPKVYDARWRVVREARRIVAELEKSHVDE